MTAVITRPRSQAKPLVTALERAGARVIAAPLIKIVPPLSFARLDRALRRLESFDAVVFSSANAADCFFARAKKLRLKLRRPRIIFAIGPATAKALRRRRWPSRQPKIHQGEGLALAMGRVRGLKILIPRAEIAREILPRMLRRKGARVSVVETYRTVPDREGIERLKKAVRSGKIDLVTFTSPSTVHQFTTHLKGAAHRLFQRAAAAAIGPVTGAALKKRGIHPSIIPRSADGKALARAVREYFS